MKVFTITTLASVLSVAMARDVFFEHERAVDAIAKRGLEIISRRQSGNLAVFTGALGGIAITAITCSGDATRQFEVNGNTFVGFGAASQRACSIQNNACSDAANAGGQTFTVGDCGAQEEQCNAAESASTPTCDGTTAASTGAAAAVATTAAAAVTTTSVPCAAATPTTTTTSVPCAAATPTTTTAAAASVTCTTAKRRRNAQQAQAAKQ